MEARPRLLNYPDSVQFLYALGNEIKTAKFGLERIRTALAALGNPQNSLRFVHVAGTNGKGSTCAMIESGLRAAGHRTGLFTSPHLAEPTERIRINGEAVSAAQFAAAFDRVHERVERLVEASAIDLHTTYFETVTAMAFLIFLDERVDTVALEVGLGGRLDATNVVTPELAVITPIDFDHEVYLGKSLDSIAGEKAGILKYKVPAVFSRQRPEAALVVDARAAELAAPVTRAEAFRIEDLELDARGSRFRLRSSQKMPDLHGLLDLYIRCNLAGEHQVDNAATAALALARLGIANEAIEQGIAAAKWPGRLERVSESPEIILDGAHNPAGARALANYIDRFYSGRRVRMIYGAMRDKAVEEIGGILFPRAAQVIATAPKQARALSPESIPEIAPHPNLTVAASLEDALALVEDAGPNDAIFITGSLFLVAEARAMIGRTP
jgi:dihydrofolate synthase/folylpolyglutamate synthase